MNCEFVYQPQSGPRFIVEPDDGRGLVNLPSFTAPGSVHLLVDPTRWVVATMAHVGRQERQERAQLIRAMPGLIPAAWDDHGDITIVVDKRGACAALELLLDHIDAAAHRDVLLRLAEAGLILLRADPRNWTRLEVIPCQPEEPEEPATWSLTGCICPPCVEVPRGKAEISLMQHIEQPGRSSTFHAACARFPLRRLDEEATGGLGRMESDFWRYEGKAWEARLRATYPQVENWSLGRMDWSYG